MNSYSRIDLGCCFGSLGRARWYYPIASIGFPLSYALFLLIQAVALGFNTSIFIPTTQTPLIYPYFFVNLETQKLHGVLMWIVILGVAFAAVGYLFFGIDRLIKAKANKSEMNNIK